MQPVRRVPIPKHHCILLGIDTLTIIEHAYDRNLFLCEAHHIFCQQHKKLQLLSLPADEAKKASYSNEQDIDYTGSPRTSCLRHPAAQYSENYNIKPTMRRARVIEHLSWGERRGKERKAREDEGILFIYK